VKEIPCLDSYVLGFMVVSVTPTSATFSPIIVLTPILSNKSNSSY
jgi:hypothetical protein